MEKTYSNILVTVQFMAIALMAATGPWLADRWYLLAVELLGVALGIYAIKVMRIGNFNVRPIVKEQGQLITHGPYRFIRHPMYMAIMLTLTPLLIDFFSWFRLGVMLVLLFNLIIKQLFEEGLLKAHFPSYEEYMKHTHRMIPFIF